MSSIVAGAFTRQGRRARVAAAFFAALAAGIGIQSCTTSTNPVPVATVVLQPPFDSLEAGASFAPFSISMRDLTGNELTGRQVQWGSANNSIAIVGQTGVVTGVAAGQTLITATSEGKSGMATVRVLVPIASVVVTPDSLEVALSMQGAIQVQLVGPGGEAIAGRTVTWASANSAIATVNTNGIVTPLSVGQTTITASAGTKSAASKVVVKPLPVSYVLIQPNAPVQIVRLGQSLQLTAQCFASNGTVLTGRELRWLSNNPAAVSVGQISGTVTGIALGQGIVTAECEGPTASVTIQVTPVPVSSTSISPPQLTMLVGQQQQLAVTAKDSAGNALSTQGRQVVWTSDNLPVATVSGAGVVQGVAAGEARVEVSVDGVVSPAITVMVQNVPVASVTVTPNPGAVKVGLPLPMAVTLRDVSGNVLAGRTVTWTSLHPNIATVDLNTGIVTGVAPGNATIQAASEGVVGNAVVIVTP